MVEELGAALIKGRGSFPRIGDDWGQKEKKQKWIRDEKVIGWRDKSLPAIMGQHVYHYIPHMSNRVVLESQGRASFRR